MRVRLLDNQYEIPGEVANFDTNKTVELLVVCGKHYSSLWSLRIKIGEWNGIPRIIEVDTIDNYNDR